jgi:hypothetical protein
MTSDLPKLIEVEPKVLTWRFYDAMPIRTRLFAFACFAGFGWVLISIASVLAFFGRETPFYAFGILALFFVLWTLICAFICFVSVHHFADGVRKELRRTVLLANRPVCISRLKVAEGDSIVMCHFGDREHGGSQHRVYLQRGTQNYLVGYFRLSELGPSVELTSMCDSIAQALGITNAGYKPFGNLIFSWLTTFRLLR